MAANFVIVHINITGGRHQHTIKLELFSHHTTSTQSSLTRENAMKSVKSGDSFAKYLQIDKQIKSRMRLKGKTERLQCTELLVIKFLLGDHNSRFGGEDK